MYLDYEFYQLNSGKVTDLTTFNYLNRKAQSIVDWYTFNRLNKVEIIEDKIKFVIVDLVDYLNDNTQDNASSGEVEIKGANISSISNNGISISYQTKSPEQGSKEVKDIVEIGLANISVRINNIDVNLLYRGVL